MFSSSNASNSSEASSDSRMAVADILSSMANGGESSNHNFSALDILSSGIPTRTTPTLTPTTLRNIEEFIELQSVPPEPMKHQHQAGFVPPLVSLPASSNGFRENSDSDTSMEEKSSQASGYSIGKSCQNSFSRRVSPSPNSKSTGRVGGRRPNDDSELTPEEAERRELRRERNKLAAARCRKRRLDHTNILVQETENLEDKRQALQNEIQMLECQKEELRFILEAHKATCHYGNSLEEINVKPVVTQPSNMNNMQANHLLVSRPTSLPVTSQFMSSQIPQNSISSSIVKTENSDGLSGVTGIPISTPSNGIFNFDSYMDGGTGFTPVSSTGLTPIVPSCSAQQRNSSSDLSSPDTVNPPKLVSL